ncbi:Metalloenzyme, LuxS/M16 peptidase-like protein [Hyaloraphidium curvatum]|nr:Metalloenzyme, LuxS/M16 peptidase-like protein [Hyaloraphidium curvatum]
MQRHAAQLVAKRGYAVLPSSRSPLVVNIKRAQPAAAAAAPKAVSKAGGVTVATLDLPGPSSSVAVVLKAGSRFEPKDAPGVSHFLKDYTFKDTAEGTALRQAREAELMGNYPYAALTREYIVVGTDFLRDNLVDVVPNLLSQVLANLMVRHQFADVAADVAAETQAALADPATVVADALHRTAFRGGLGNSLFAAPESAKKITRTKVLEYLAKTAGPENLAVVGAGVDHEDLVSLVDAVLRGADLGSGAPAQAASSYHGGEARIEAPGPSRYVVATEGVPFGTADHAAALVLKGILGSGAPRVKYAVPSGSAAAPFAKLSGKGVTVEAVSASYSDTGLFGISVVADDAAAVRGAVEGAVAAIKAAGKGPSAADLARGKKAAAVELEEQATREGILHMAAQQVIASGSFSSPAELVSKIDAVTADQVAKIVHKITHSRTSVVAYGNIRELPYADELKF